jgi:NAD(P)H-nitrite reductase large subunit
MATRHVVVGGGPAGLFAVETIRALDPAAAVTLVTDEPPYSRMVLPYYIAGEIPETQVFTGSDDHWARLRTSVVRGRRATGLDPRARRLTLADGDTIPYDRLLLATGSSPIRPDLAGADGERVHNLWTLADARRTIEVVRAVRPGAPPRVVFIGAGFIGFIVLNALAKLGCRLAVVEVEGQILPRMLDAEAASLGRRWLETRGVEVHTGVRAVAIGEAGHDKTVRLSDGTILNADLVVMAIGVRPNVELARAGGLRVERGIVVDRHLRTSAPDVHAAGDCAEGPDVSTGGLDVHAIQPTAVEHGRVAGANMAGQPIPYDGSLAMNILDVVGLQCASFGRWRSGGGSATAMTNAGRPLYRKLVWEGDRLVGAILLGPAEDVALLNDLGMIKGLIQARVALGPWAEELRRNPMDVRRAFVGAGGPAALLPRTLLGRPLTDQRYRFAAGPPGDHGRAADVPTQIKLHPTRGKGAAPAAPVPPVILD